MAPLSVVLFVLGQTAAMALIASTALAAGLPWLRGLSMTGTERVGLALALGLAVVGQLALGLGLVGRLGPAVIAALVVVVHVAARRDLRDLSVQARRRWNQLGRPAQRAGVALGALMVLPIVVRALYPPLAFDETLYHLPFARAFAATGRLPFLADLRFPVFPQLVEAVFAAVMSLAGDVATHGVSVVATLATALLVGGWARRAAGRGGAAAGGLAAAFVLGQPIGVHLGASANVEPALALFAVAAVYAVHRWRDDGGRGWLVLAGVLAGSAASTKYLGLLIVTGAAIEIAVAGVRRGAVRSELIYGLTAAVAMATSYGRLLYHTSNPVFPFLPAVFGSTAWDFDAYVPDRGWQRGLALVTLPWDLVFDRAAVGGLPPFHPLLPVVLPAMVALACRHRAVRAWMLWTVGYVLLVPVNAHYLWTIVPFVALALGVWCGEALDRLRAGRAGTAGARRVHAAWAAGLLVCVLPATLYGAYRIVLEGPMPVDGATRAAFLAARLPLFSAVSFLNSRCGAGCTTYAVHAENMVYHAAGRFLGDVNGPASFARTLPPDGDPTVLLAALRRLGADHLLVPAAARRQVGLSGAETPGLRPVYADPAADVYEVSPARPSP